MGGVVRSARFEGRGEVPSDSTAWSAAAAVEPSAGAVAGVAVVGVGVVVEPASSEGLVCDSSPQPLQSQPGHSRIRAVAWQG